MNPPREFMLMAALMLHKRVAIAGGPGAGKSIAALVRDRPVIGTDAYMTLPWSDVPHAVIAEWRAAHPDVPVVIL